MMNSKSYLLTPGAALLLLFSFAVACEDSGVVRASTDAAALTNGIAYKNVENSTNGRLLAQTAVNIDRCTVVKPAGVNSQPLHPEVPHHLSGQGIKARWRCPRMG